MSNFKSQYVKAFLGLSLMLYFSAVNAENDTKNTFKNRVTVAGHFGGSTPSSNYVKESFAESGFSASLNLNYHRPKIGYYLQTNLFANPLSHFKYNTTLSSNTSSITIVSPEQVFYTTRGTALGVSKEFFLGEKKKFLIEPMVGLYFARFNMSEYIVNVIASSSQGNVRVETPTVSSEGFHFGFNLGYKLSDAWMIFARYEGYAVDFNTKTRLSSSTATLVENIEYKVRADNFSLGIGYNFGF